MSTITKLAIAGVTASGNDGNLPTNVLDGNPATRWSSLGLGQFITLDLGSGQLVSEVDIAWYKGDTRKNTFTIELSVDNATWVNVLSTTSTGNTLAPEKYIIMDTGAAHRYIKITVNGNSTNLWASITEVSVIGSVGTRIRKQARHTSTAGEPVIDANWIIDSDTGPLSGPNVETLTVADQAISTSGPINIQLSAQDSEPASVVTLTIAKPPAGGTLSGGTGNTYTYHPNAGFTGVDAFNYQASNNKGLISNIGTVTITVSPVIVVTNVDKFGIQKMYGDRQGTYNNWVQTTASDPRFFEGRVADAGNGWLKAAGGSTEIRIEVLSDTSANESTIPTFDVGKVIAKGYLYKPIDSADGKGDFGDFEMTWRVRGKAGSGTQNGECHTELVPGGYRQTSETTKVGADKAVPAGCEAMSYHFNCYPLTGRVKYEKDSMHTSGYTKSDPEKKNAIAKFDNMQEIIQKAVLYRTTKGVKLETYVDESGSGTAFKKVLEFEDSGQWGPTRGGNKPCNCGEFPILSMGRVALGYRGDNWTTFEFKDASIRSIDSTKSLATHADAPHENMVEEDIVRSDDKPSVLKAKGNIKEE